MDPNSLALLMGSAGGAAAGPATYVEDVFQTWLYTGNSSTQTITNGIDLSGKGGLVWTKGRSAVIGHALFDTARGRTKAIFSNTTDPEQTYANDITSFNSNGYSLGNTSGYLNNELTYASWTFRKAAKFFDVVTYTGNGTSQSIAHNLGSEPGFVIIKAISTSGNWLCYHRSLEIGNAVFLNLTNASTTASDISAVSSTTFSVSGNQPRSNGSGQTYVAYLFAHDAGGFGDSGNDNVISCGTFTGSGAGNTTTVTLGWEPQWILAKRTDGAQNWVLMDNTRGMPNGGDTALLYPNLSNAESTGIPSTGYLRPTATGFLYGPDNYMGDTAQIIYIAIRRGPMKTPTDATKVFAANTSSASAGTKISTSFPVDMQIAFERDNSLSTACGAVNDRLRGVSSTSTQMIRNLLTHSTAAEGTSGTGSRNWDNTGFEMPNYPSTLSNIFWNFRRAPGFFDVVAYAGTGASITINHNLGVTPELIIGKCRSAVFTWVVYHQFLGTGAYIALNTDAARILSSLVSAVSATSFTGEANAMSSSGNTHIAYLFASCPGVSKVFNFTGTGTTLQINCGFTSGARLVLIKRTDSTGDWYIWDSARGIISGNDPYLLLNSTAAEVTNTDYIDPYSAGFEISSTAPAAINANGGSYIGLAIA